MRPIRTPIFALVASGVLWLPACGPESPGTGAAAGAGADTTPPPPPAPQREFERSVVFISSTGDSVLVVPWIIQSYSRPGSVARLARGWLARGGTWEAFLRDEWEAPPAQEPWRILPHGPLRILVGMGDRLDRLVYEGGSRQLEVSLGETVAEWTGNRGSSFNVVEGGLILADRRVPGRVLDVSQGIRREEGFLGDWLFLTSGDSVSLVVQAPAWEETTPAFQGWAKDGFQDYQWPEVEVSWVESRAYEPARRDIPSILALRTEDGMLEGEVRVSAIQLEPRVGIGPVLPVDGVLDISGTLLLGGRPVPVQGVMRHRRP